MENNNQNMPQPLPLNPPVSFWASHKIAVIIIALAAVASTAVAEYFILNQPRDLGLIVVEHKALTASSTNAVLHDDSDMQPQKVTVPDADNGFFDLNALGAGDIIQPSKQDYPAGNFTLNYLPRLDSGAEKWNQKLVDKVLASNQKALQAISSAAGKKYFQLPTLVDPSVVDANTKLYPLNSWRDAARLQAIKALSLSWRGKPDGALLEAVKLNQLAHNMINSNTSDIEILVAIAFQRMGSETILKVLPYGQPSQQTLKQVADILNQTNDNSAGYKNMFKMDYVVTLNNLQEFVNNPDQGMPTTEDGPLDASQQDPNLKKMMQNSFYYNDIETKNMFQDFYRVQMQAVGQRCDTPELDNKYYVDTSKAVTTENYIGKSLIYIIAMTGILKVDCQNQLESNAAMTQLAMRSYKDDHGNLPGQLIDLVPSYLPTVPLDPFNNQPLHYDSTKKVIYSVGIDGKGVGEIQVNNDPLSVPNPIAFQINF